MSEHDAPSETAPAATERPDDPVDALEARLGTRLPDRAAALAAVTHKSYVNEHRDEDGLQDNERLEFLGDAVIDLAVSHRLMERFPAAREGELSKMRAAVVDELGLSEMARALELGGLLRLGRGEELTGGRQKASLLADAMEAVIAAVYLGGGLAAVLGVVDRFLGEAFARAVSGTLDRDFKTQLQELAQSRLRATPRYRVVAEYGPDHSKTFEVESDVRGEVIGRGAGRSKKDAEQAAAKLALDSLGRRFAAAGAGAAAAACAAAPSLPPPGYADASPPRPPEIDTPPAPPGDVSPPGDRSGVPVEGSEVPPLAAAVERPRASRTKGRADASAKRSTPRRAAAKSAKKSPAPARTGRRRKA